MICVCVGSVSALCVLMICVCVWVQCQLWVCVMDEVAVTDRVDLNS